LEDPTKCEIGQYLQGEKRKHVEFSYIGQVLSNLEGINKMWIWPVT
jgi:hypothetical protein